MTVSAHDDGRDDRYGEQLVRLGYKMVPPGVKLNLEGKHRAWSAWAAIS